MPNEPTNTAIPVHVEDLKRGDVLRILVNRVEVEVRVAGLKQEPATERCYYSRVRVNVVHKDGRRQPLYFRTDGGSPIERFALKMVPVPSLHELPGTLMRDDVQDGSFVVDGDGDIAYRCRDIGAWVCLRGEWTPYPLLWDWATEGHRTWKLVAQMKP